MVLKLKKKDSNNSDSNNMDRKFKEKSIKSKNKNLTKFKKIAKNSIIGFRPNFLISAIKKNFD